jgi:hypothetical protein
MAVFWVVAPCSLVEVSLRLRGDCCLHHQGDDLNQVLLSSQKYVLHNVYEISLK